MSDSSPTREEAVQMGRKGGKRSSQQDVRNVDADTMWRRADRRATQDTATRRDSQARRSPTPSRTSKASSGSGARRRTQSGRSRSHSRVRPAE